MHIKLEDTHTFRFVTSQFSTGAVFDATGTPTCEVLEEATDTAILSPTVVKPTGTGEYRVTIACTAANGFEAGKVYNVQISATVDAIASTAYIATFKVQAKDIDTLLDMGTSEIYDYSLQAVQFYDGPTNTEMLAAFSALQDLSTSDVGLVLEAYDGVKRAEATADKDAIIAQGDAAWATATGFSTSEIASEVSVRFDSVDAQVAALNDMSTSDTGLVVEEKFAVYDGPTRTEATADKDEIIARGDLAWITFAGAVLETSDIYGMLEEYDGPTRAEATLDKDAILAQGNAAWLTATGFATSELGSEVNDWFESLNDVATSDLNAALEAYDGPTAAELTAGLSGLNDVSTSQLNDALEAYDVPTRTEMTADKDEVLASVSALANLGTSDLGVVVERSLTLIGRAEPGSVPPANAPMTEKIDWIFAHCRNRLIAFADEQVLYADDGTTPIGTAALTNTSDQFIRDEYV